jgi:photosystem II stability/assembly factor-like uncharacterized protein
LTDAGITAASADAPIAVLNKSGYNWIEGESIHWAGSIEFDPFNPKRVFVTSGNGVYMADDFSPGKRFTWYFTVKNLEETVPEDLVSIPGGPLITVIGDYDGFVHDDIAKPVRAGRHQPQMGSTTGIDFAAKNPGVVVRVGGNDKAADDKDYVFPLYYSTDTGATWTKFKTHPGPQQNYRGKIAVSCDGKAVIWNPEGKNIILRTDDWGATWTTSSGISGQKCFPTADPVNPGVFYAFSSGVYKSADKGASFTKVGGANFSWTSDMQVTPGREGHVWVTGFAWDGINGGFLGRSTDGGATFMNVDPEASARFTQKIQHCEAVGFGREAPGASYPAIYMEGTIGGVRGIWMSIDEAGSWTRINDDRHRYGALSNGNFLRGDANTFGVVYRSTAGRGIAARFPAAWSETGVISEKVPRGGRRSEASAAGSHGAKERGRIQVYSLDGRLLLSKKSDAFIDLGLRRILIANGAGVLVVTSADGRTLVRRTIHCIR